MKTPLDLNLLESGPKCYQIFDPPPNPHSFPNYHPTHRESIYNIFGVGGGGEGGVFEIFTECGIVDTTWLL